MMIAVLLAASAALTAGVVMSQPKGTVYPFAPTKPSSADTLASDAETVFADDGWTVATLSRLSDVEDLLDNLEAHRVAEREVRVLGNSSFRVRWK
ncbi:MAG: hypothetical protein MUF18_11920 [Fimbriiglobus sp.]|jgi:hypothetical protein|nr:hypothetical protein [Fimbriiglobus sp.]